MRRLVKSKSPHLSPGVSDVFGSLMTIHGERPKPTQDDEQELAELKRERGRCEWQREGLAEKPAKQSSAHEEERGEQD